VCVTGSGASACGSSSASKKSFSEKKRNVDSHVFTGEVRSTGEMDSAVIAHQDGLSGDANEQAFFVRENGEIAFAEMTDSTSSCATIRLPTDVSGLAHTHTSGGPAETLARELPGPLDIDALRKGLVQYIITPTNAIRKKEVVKTGSGTYEPRLTTIRKGDVFTRGRQVRKIDKWKRAWSDSKNFKVINGL
jgi:hypothetical protein